MKVLHFSDLHLGKWPLSSEPGNRHLRTFNRIINLAMDHDILIAAGDLINSPDIDDDWKTEICAGFRILNDSDIKTLLIPGSGEKYPTGAYASFLFEAGATEVLTDPQKAFTYSSSGENIKIISSDKDTELPSSQNEENTCVINVLYVPFEEGMDDFHLKALLNPVETKSPWFNYCAMGGYHQFKLLKNINRINGAFPGSPEPLSPSEEGDRYAISLKIKSNKVSGLKRIPVQTGSYRTINVDCENIKSSSDIFQKLPEKRTKDMVLTVNLTGKRIFPVEKFKIEELSKKYMCFSLNDMSIPRIELLIEEYFKEDSLRGEFFCTIKRELEEKSGRIGIDDPETLSAPVTFLVRDELDKLENWLCEL